MSNRDNEGRQPVGTEAPFPDPFLEEVVLRKVTRRLIPFIFIMYVVNILDRVNVNFASVDMMRDLDLTQREYGLGAGIFYLGYCVFEVPSNLILRRVGARRWLARILVSWGIISASMMFVVGPGSFCLLRTLLGFAEAGFFPGIILYLSTWFPARQRAQAVARFMTGSAVTGIVGGPVSTALLQYMDGVAGLTGWQWLYLLEGLPAVVLGLVALSYLTDSPGQAHWLEPHERAWLADRMHQEEKYREERHGFTLMQAMANRRVWLLCLLYFTVAMGANGYGLYSFQILKDRFAGATKIELGFLTAVPGLVAMVGMVLIGIHSDRTGERRWHVAGPAFLAATGWLVAAYVESPWLALAGLALALMGMMSMLAPFWSLPTSFLSGAAAAGGIALINSVGNLGGFVAPNVIGQVKAATGSFTDAMLFLAGAMVVGGFLALCARHDRTVEHQRLPGEKEL